MDALISIFYFVVAVAILIVVHEWGHFIVARACGVKVLRFAVGFGKPIFKYQGRKGTEYVVGIIPLGGYVKMLDEEESEEPIPEEELKYAFNRKSLLAKMAIVAAGPFLNMVFAVFALWLMFVIGMTTLAPIVGTVTPKSIAAEAGLVKMDEVLSVANKEVKSWRDFQLEMVTHIGAKKRVSIKVKNVDSLKHKDLKFDLNEWVLNPKKPDVLKSLGLQPYLPDVKPIADKILKGLPAFKAGIQKGDLIFSIDGERTPSWFDVLQIVRKSANKPLKMIVLRNNKQTLLNITPGAKKINGEDIGYIGLSVKQFDWPKGWLRVQRYSFGVAFIEAFKETWNLTQTSFKMLWKFVTGKVSLRNIGGPIGIAQGAGQSAKGGTVYYLAFLALVSVSLGILNILPVPMLDGGHLMFYIIEGIRRRPLSKGVKEKSMVVGLILLLMLTVLAIFNDVIRLMN